VASALRFGVDFFREDHRVLWADLSLVQMACLFLFSGACLLLYVKRKWNWQEPYTPA